MLSMLGCQWPVIWFLWTKRSCKKSRSIQDLKGSNPALMQETNRNNIQNTSECQNTMFTMCIPCAYHVHTMCQDVPGVKSIKSVASLSRTFAASSIGSMKPKPFFSLNLRTWHLVWAQECQMQDEQQNSSKSTHATISAHHPKSKTLGVGQVGRCFQTLAVTPAWHCAKIFKTISWFNTDLAARPSHSATQERSFILHLRSEAAKQRSSEAAKQRSSEAAKQDGNWVDWVDLSDLFGVLHPRLLLAIRRRLSIHYLTFCLFWHCGIIVASLWQGWWMLMGHAQ